VAAAASRRQATAAGQLPRRAACRFETERPARHVRPDSARRPGRCSKPACGPQSAPRQGAPTGPRGPSGTIGTGQNAHAVPARDRAHCGSSGKAWPHLGAANGGPPDRPLDAAARIRPRPPGHRDRTGSARGGRAAGMSDRVDSDNRGKAKPPSRRASRFPERTYLHRRLLVTKAIPSTDGRAKARMT